MGGLVVSEFVGGHRARSGEGAATFVSATESKPKHTTLVGRRERFLDQAAGERPEVSTRNRPRAEGHVAYPGLPSGQNL